MLETPYMFSYTNRFKGIIRDCNDGWLMKNGNVDAISIQPNNSIKDAKHLIAGRYACENKHKHFSLLKK